MTAYLAPLNRACAMANRVRAFIESLRVQLWTQYHDAGQMQSLIEGEARIAARDTVRADTNRDEFPEIVYIACDKLSESGQLFVFHPSAWDDGIPENILIAEYRITNAPVTAGDGADTIDDDFGNVWGAFCERCGRRSMVIVRIGKAQCQFCD